MYAARKYDILDAYHNDYDLDMHQEDEEIELLCSVHSISLGDIMGEDHDVWIQKNSNFGFNIEIDDENSIPILKEKGVHPYAMDSLALFCKKFLNRYQRYQGDS